MSRHCPPIACHSSSQSLHFSQPGRRPPASSFLACLLDYVALSWWVAAPRHDARGSSIPSHPIPSLPFPCPLQPLSHCPRFICHRVPHHPGKCTSVMMYDSHTARRNRSAAFPHVKPSVNNDDASRWRVKFFPSPNLAMGRDRDRCPNSLSLN